MIYGIKSIQDQGKTLIGVALLLQLCNLYGYEPAECYGNLVINLKGYHPMTSQGMRDLMGRMVRERLQHKVLFFDEINRVYPARFWKDQERTQELLTVWQDEKMFTQIIYTTHVGNSVDILVREATQIILVPRFDKPRDLITVEVVNSLDLECHTEEVRPASNLFSWYDRWAPVE